MAKKVEQIWIVSGATGEYSDRHEWITEAFDSESAAQARVARLGQLMRELAVNINTDWSKRDAARKAMREHAEGDPMFSIDYTGTSYSIASCVLVRS